MPESLVMPATLSLINKALLISILFLVFTAFSVLYSIDTLIAGFSIGYLFKIISPTPAGIGFVGVALTLGLHSLNVPLGDATQICPSISHLLSEYSHSSCSGLMPNPGSRPPCHWVRHH
jgi:uncharacterized membrane protein YbhN (UPF0104 family)